MQTYFPSCFWVGGVRLIVLKLWYTLIFLQSKPIPDNKFLLRKSYRQLKQKETVKSYQLPERQGFCF